MSRDNFLISSEVLCNFKDRVCNRRVLPGLDFCDFHIYSDTSLEINRCNYVHESTSVRCIKPVINRVHNTSLCYDHEKELNHLSNSYSQCDSNYTNLKTEAYEQQSGNASPLSTHSTSHTSQVFPEEQLSCLMQTWEKQEDLNIPQHNQDILDRWSSDGGSVSSSSPSEYSSDNPSSDFEENMDIDIEHYDSEKPLSQAKILQNKLSRHHNMHLLRRAQYYSISEGLEMSLDRWRNYRHQCRRTMRFLGHQLITSYVPHAINCHRANKQAVLENIISQNGNDPLQEMESKNGNNLNQKLSSRFLLEQKALRNFGKHSSKTANLRYDAYMSKFAIMCSQVAPWRRSTNPLSTVNLTSSIPHTASLNSQTSSSGNMIQSFAPSVNLSLSQSSVSVQHQCKYRDPTTTTWEKHCTQLAIPLMQYCLNHLVLLNFPKTKTYSIQLNTKGQSLNETFKVDSVLASSSPTKVSKCASQPVSPLQSSLATVAEETDEAENSFEATSTFSICNAAQTNINSPQSKYSNLNKHNISNSLLQASNAPMQYLFRHCGAQVESLICFEPIVNWSVYARCPKHTTAETIWPDINPNLKNEEKLLPSSKIIIDLASSNKETHPIIYKAILGTDGKPELDQKAKPIIKTEDDITFNEKTVIGENSSVIDRTNPAIDKSGATDLEISKNNLTDYNAGDILILAAVRSPVGKFRGVLSKLEAHEIGGQVISALLARATNKNLPRKPICVVKPEEILALGDELGSDEISQWYSTNFNCCVLGQVFTAGCGQNPARQAATLAGIPFSIPSWGVNMLCGSGLLAVGLAFDRLRNRKLPGIAIAGGQESMTKARQLLERTLTKTTEIVFTEEKPVDSMVKDGLTDAFTGIHMGHTAENIALKYRISREDQDEFALKSQRSYQCALEKGYFSPEMVEIIVDESKISFDEHPRPMGPNASLASLKPAFSREGFTNTVTAANASGVNDGAAALFLVRNDILSENLDFLKISNAELCRIVDWVQIGCQPETMGLGPVFAIRTLLKNIDWPIESVQRFELNEAFSVQSIAVLAELKIDQSKVNVCGGAIAIGHPLGCSGARTLVTLVHEMARLRQSINIPVRGIAALCVGGGMGIALAVEKL